MSKVAESRREVQSPPSMAPATADAGAVPAPVEEAIPVVRVREMFGLADPRLQALLRGLLPPARALVPLTGAVLPAAEVERLRTTLLAELSASLRKDPTRAARILGSKPFLEAYHASGEATHPRTVDPARGGAPSGSVRQRAG